LIKYEQIPSGDGAGYQRNGITWLASWPKSGNTWVRLFLSAYLNNPDDFSLAKENITGDGSIYHYQSVTPIPLSSLSMEGKFRIRDAALEHHYVSSLKTNLLMKTHNANVELNRRYLIPADLTHKAIYIVRDPRDVALSYARYMDNMGIDKSVQQMLDPGAYIMGRESIYIPSFISSWGQHVDSWWAEDKFPVAFVRYEDLMTDPKRIFSRLLEFLEIDYHEDRFNKSVEVTSMPNLKKMEGETGFVGNPTKGEFFYRGGSRWKDELPEEHAEKIRDAFGETMDKFNY